MSIREKYNIPQDAKVLLYVGNISKNKNQAQMVRAFGLLPNEIRNNTWVLFCGEDHAKDGEMEHLIETTPDHKHLVLCGGIDRIAMPDYYKEANGVVLLSFAEGFGLSLIEGMHFGLPCVMPKDLDAYEDIYNPNSVVSIKDRDDKSVAEGLELLLTGRWNKEQIKAHSKKFESQNMAKQYIKAYKRV